MSCTILNISKFQNVEKCGLSPAENAEMWKKYGDKAGGQGVSEKPTHGGEMLENIQTSHSRNQLVATNTSDMPVASQMPKRWWCVGPSKRGQGALRR